MAVIVRRSPEEQASRNEAQKRNNVMSKHLAVTHHWASVFTMEKGWHVRLVKFADMQEYI